MNDLLKRNAGLDFSTPAQLRVTVEDLNLTPRQRSRALAFAAEWETELGYKLVDRLKATSEQIKEQRELNRKKIEEGQRRCAEVEHLMSTGRMTTNDGLKEITRLARQHREALAVQDSLRQSVERWEEDADQTVDDHLQEQVKRFPVLKAAMSRRLTETYLRGEEPSPFRGGS